MSEGNRDRSFFKDTHVFDRVRPSTEGKTLRIGIVGCNAAGINAALAARKADHKASIFIVESEDVPAYSRCGLPYAMSGEIDSFENLIVFPRSYYKMMKIDLNLKTTAKSINVKEKSLLVEGSGKEQVLEYDRLVLATGSRVYTPPVKGLDLAYHLRTIEDGKRISEAAAASSSALIVGGGLIGLEMAVALKEKGLRITLVEMLPQVAPSVLDPDMAQILQSRLEKKGIEIITGSGIQSIEKNHGNLQVLLPTGSLTTDLVIAATGTIPNTELAKNAGIRIGESGGIQVNARLQTSVKEIYAAGECAELLHMITSRPVLSQLGTTAARSGRVAGVNAGGGYAVMPSILNSTVSKLFGIEVGSTGMTERQTQRQGLETISGKIAGKTKAAYYPGAGDIVAKLIFEKENMRLIGGQIIGEEEVTQRVNLLSMAIRTAMTVWDLQRAETCYTPPLAETWEVSIHEASEAALAKMKRVRG